MTTHTFPLLRLPNNVRNNVLRNFNVDQLLDISFISTRTKAMIKSLNIPVGPICFSICTCPNIVIKLNGRDEFIAYRMSTKPEIDSEVRDLEKPVFLCRGGRRAVWFPRNPETAKNHLQHVLGVLNKPKLDYLNFQCDPEDFDLAVVRRNFSEVTTIQTRHHYTMNYYERILAHFPNVPNFFTEGPLSTKIITQNFDYLFWHPDPLKLSLGDLLALNSQRIQIETSTLSEKLLNQFLKSWIRGACRRLKMLEICLSPANRPFNQHEIMKRISHQRNMETREFELFGVKQTIRGGMDIRRKDGILGTVIIDHVRGFSRIKLFVWDHSFS